MVSVAATGAKRDVPRSHPYPTMANIRHPALMKAERLAEGTEVELQSDSRADLRLIVHELTDGDVFDADDIEAEQTQGDTASVSKADLIDVVQYVAEAEAETGE